MSAKTITLTVIIAITNLNLRINKQFLGYFGLIRIHHW